MTTQVAGLSRGETARILGLSPERVHQLMTAGVIKYQQTPLGRLADPESVMELKRAREAKKVKAVGGE